MATSSKDLMSTQTGGFGETIQSSPESEVTAEQFNIKLPKQQVQASVQPSAQPEAIVPTQDIPTAPIQEEVIQPEIQAEQSSEDRLYSELNLTPVNLQGFNEEMFVDQPRESAIKPQGSYTEDGLYISEDPNPIVQPVETKTEEVINEEPMSLITEDGLSIGSPEQDKKVELDKINTTYKASGIKVDSDGVVRKVNKDDKEKPNGTYVYAGQPDAMYKKVGKDKWLKDYDSSGNFLPIEKDAARRIALLERDAKQVGDGKDVKSKASINTDKNISERFGNITDFNANSVLTASGSPMVADNIAFNTLIRKNIGSETERYNQDGTLNFNYDEKKAEIQKSLPREVANLVDYKGKPDGIYSLPDSDASFKKSGNNWYKAGSVNGKYQPLTEGDVNQRIEKLEKYAYRTPKVSEIATLRTDGQKLNIKAFGTGYANMVDETNRLLNSDALNKVDLYDKAFEDANEFINKDVNMLMGDKLSQEQKDGIIQKQQEIKKIIGDGKYDVAKASVIAESLKDAEEFFNASKAFNVKVNEGVQQGKSLARMSLDNKKKTYLEHFDLKDDSNIQINARELFEITSKMSDFVLENIENGNMRADTKNGGYIYSPSLNSKERNYIESKLSSMNEAYDKFNNERYSATNDRIIQQKSNKENTQFNIEKLEKSLAVFGGDSSRPEYQDLYRQLLKERKKLEYIDIIIEDEEISKSTVFLTQPKKLVQAVSTNMSPMAENIFNAIPSDITPKQRFDFYYEQLQADNNKLAKDNNLDDGYFQSVNRRFKDLFDWDGFYKLSDVEKTYLQNVGTLNQMSTLYYNNDTGFTNESTGFFESFMNGIAQTLTPKTAKADGYFAKSEMNNTMISELTNQGFDPDGYVDKATIQRMEERAAVDFMSRENLGKMGGSTVGIITPLVLTGGVGPGILKLGVGLEKLLVGVQGTSKVLTTLNKAENIYDATLSTTKLGRFLLPVSKAGIEQGIKFEIGGSVVGSTEGELNWFNGLAGGILSESLTGIMAGAPKTEAYKWVKSIFGNKTSDAIDIMKSAGKISARGVAEIGDETGSQLASIYSQTDNFQEMMSAIEEQYGSIDKVEEFLLSTFVMGSAFGIVSPTSSKDAYFALPDDKKARLDKILAQIGADVASAERSVSEYAEYVKTKEGKKEAIDKLEDKSVVNDQENETGVSGEVAKGKEPIKTEPIVGAGKEEVSPSGVVQEEPTEVDTKKVDIEQRRQDEITALEAKYKIDRSKEPVVGAYGVVEVESESFKAARDKINAKYDAELAAVKPVVATEEAPMAEAVAKTPEENYATAQEVNNKIAEENPDASVLLTPKGDDLNLTAVYVGKENRGKGIGTKVLETVKSEADRTGKKIVLDTTNELDSDTNLERLGNFYEKNGFKKVGENKFEYNPQAVVTEEVAAPTQEEIDSTAKALESATYDSVKFEDAGDGKFVITGGDLKIKEIAKQSDKKESVKLPSKISFLPKIINLVHLSRNSKDKKSILKNGFNPKETSIDSPIPGVYFSSEDWSTMDRFGRDSGDKIYTSIENDGLIYFDNTDDFTNYLKENNLPYRGETLSDAQLQVLKDKGVKAILLREDFASRSRNELIVIDDSIIKSVSENETEITKLPESFNNKKSIAEAYHKAKANGSSPELVKAVEDLLSKAPESSTEKAAPKEKAESWQDRIDRPMTNEELNAFRTSIRNKFPDSYASEILDLVAEARKGEVNNLPYELDNLADEITINDIGNLLSEDDLFDSRRELNAYLRDRSNAGDMLNITKESKEESKIEEKFESLGDRIRAGKISGTGMAMSAIPGFKEAFNGSLEIVATAVDAGVSIAKAITEGFKKIKESQWYKDLGKEQRTQAFEDYKKGMNEKFPKKRISKAERDAAKEFKAKVDEATGTAKEEPTVSMTNSQVLREQLKNKEAGAKDAVKFIQGMKEQIRAYAKENLPKELYSKAQTDLLMKSISKAETAKALDTAITRIDKMIENKAEAKRILTAKNIVKKIKNKREFLTKVNDKWKGKTTVESQREFKEFINSGALDDLELKTQEELDAIMKIIEDIIDTGKADFKTFNNAKEDTKKVENATLLKGLAKTPDVILNTREEIIEFLENGGAVIIQGRLYKKADMAAFKPPSAKNKNTSTVGLPDSYFSNVEGYEAENIAFTREAVRRRDAKVFRRVARALNPLNAMSDIYSLLKGTWAKSDAVKKYVTDNIERPLIKAMHDILHGQAVKIREYYAGFNEIFGSKRKGISRLSDTISDKDNPVNNKLREFYQITNSHMVNYYNLLRVENGPKRLAKSGVDVLALEKYMDANQDLKDYADFLMQKYEDSKVDYEPIYEAANNMPFPEKLYYPEYASNFDEDFIDIDSVLNEDGTINAMSAVTNNLKQRTRFNDQYDLNMNAHNVYLNYIKNMEHSRNLFEIAKKTNQLFSTTNAPYLITNMGLDKYNELREHMAVILSNSTPKTGTTTYSKGISQLLNFSVLSTLGFKPASIAKQFTSFTHYWTAGIADGVDPWQIWGGTVPTNKEEWDFVKSLWNSDYRKDRMRGGSIDVETKKVIDAALKSKTAKGWIIANQAAMSPIIVGDMLAVAYGPGGGSAFALATYRQRLSEGMSKEEAADYAYRRWVEETEKTQQSTRVDLTSNIQRDPLWRMAGTYRTGQASMAKKVINAVKLLNSGTTLTTREKVQAITDIVYYSAFGSVLFSVVASGAVGAMMSSDDDEDKRIRHDIVWDQIGSDLQGYGAIGHLGDWTLNAMRGDIWKNNIPVVNFVQKLATLPAIVPAASYRKFEDLSKEDQLEFASEAGAVDIFGNVGGEYINQFDPEVVAKLFEEYNNQIFWNKLTDAEARDISKAIGFKNIDDLISNMTQYIKGDKGLNDALMNYEEDYFQMSKERNKVDYLYKIFSGGEDYIIDEEQGYKINEVKLPTKPAKVIEAYPTGEKQKVYKTYN
jgi:GNAT superfamily N-acetyltransferase